jgi:hypothetical protein
MSSYGRMTRDLLLALTWRQASFQDIGASGPDSDSNSIRISHS